MKSLSLLIDGQEKKFTIPFVSGLVWRNYIALCASIDDLKRLSPEEMDQFVDLIVLAFNGQFTAEEYYKGMPFEKTLSTVDELFLPPASETTDIKKK